MSGKRVSRPRLNVDPRGDAVLYALQAHCGSGRRGSFWRVDLAHTALVEEKRIRPGLELPDRRLSIKHVCPALQVSPSPHRASDPVCIAKRIPEEPTGNDAPTLGIQSRGELAGRPIIHGEGGVRRHQMLD